MIRKKEHQRKEFQKQESSFQVFNIDDENNDADIMDARGVELAELIYENTPASNAKLKKYAAKWGNLDFLRASDGNPLIHYALLQSNYDACVILIQNGIYLESLGLSGLATEATPLMLAATISDPRFMDLLIEHKANINGGNYEQEIPLVYAIRYSQFENALRLIQYGADVNICDSTGYSPLYHTVKMGYPRMAEDLIKNGADITTQDKEGKNLLHLNMIEGDFQQYNLDGELYVPGNEMADMLIFYGCYMDVPDKSGRRPLHYAIKHNRKIAAKTLVLNDVDLNAQDIFSVAPLHIAAYNKNIYLTHLLLSHKADPNIQDKNGNTPLHYAAQHNCLPLIRTLLKFGAIRTIENNEHLTPLDLTTNKNAIELLSFPVYGQDIDTLYKNASEHEKKEAFRHYMTVKRYWDKNSKTR